MPYCWLTGWQSTSSLSSTQRGREWKGREVRTPGRRLKCFSFKLAYDPFWFRTVCSIKRANWDPRFFSLLQCFWAKSWFQSKIISFPLHLIFSKAKNIKIKMLLNPIQVLTGKKVKINPKNHHWYDKSQCKCLQGITSSQTSVHVPEIKRQNTSNR